MFTIIKIEASSDLGIEWLNLHTPRIAKHLLTRGLLENVGPPRVNVLPSSTCIKALLRIIIIIITLGRSYHIIIIITITLLTWAPWTWISCYYSQLAEFWSVIIDSSSWRLPLFVVFTSIDRTSVRLSEIMNIVDKIYL